MSDINVVSRTQRLIIDMASSSVSVSYSGPPGPVAPNPVPAGGTTGQVLTKLSDADYDYGWVTP